MSGMLPYKGYSTPALIKQINGFESQTGVKVFERSNKGIELTRGEKMFIEDARDIIARCDLAVERAKRSQASSDNLVRIVISLYHSGQPILKLCQGLFMQGTELAIQFVPVADTYDSYKYTIEHIGDEIDVLPSTRLNTQDEHNCNMEIIGNPCLCFMVPIHDELAAHDIVDISTISGRSVHVPARGNLYPIPHATR